MSQQQPQQPDSPYHVPIPPVKALSLEEHLAELLWVKLCEKNLIGVPVGLNWRWDLLENVEDQLHVKEKMIQIAKELLGKEIERDEDGTSTGPVDSNLPTS